MSPRNSRALQRGYGDNETRFRSLNGVKDLFDFSLRAYGVSSNNH